LEAAAGAWAANISAARVCQQCGPAMRPSQGLGVLKNKHPAHPRMLATRPWCIALANEHSLKKVSQRRMMARLRGNKRCTFRAGEKRLGHVFSKTILNKYKRN